MIARSLVLALGLACSASAQDVAVLELNAGTNPAVPLGYDKSELTAKAGQKIKLTLNNKGGVLPQPHNFVLMKPGTAEKVGALANAMLTDPKSAEKGYIPETPDVLAYTKLVNPPNWGIPLVGAQAKETDTVEFTAPAEPGEYPFACTFPGHWFIMKGKLIITK